MEPKLSTVLRQVMDSRLAEVHTMLPATIVSYDANAETATVKVMLKERVPVGGGGYEERDVPDIDDVPVIFPRGSGGAVFLKWKPKSGDGVSLVFSELEPSTFQTSGQASAPSDLSRHSLSYPVAIPGWSPSAQLGSTVNGSEVVLEAPEIHLGHGAEEFIARADKVEAELNNIKSAVNSHTHSIPSGTDAAGGVSGPAVNYSPGPVNCEKVKGV